MSSRALDNETNAAEFLLNFENEIVERDTREVGMNYLRFAKKHKKDRNLKSERLGIEIPNKYRKRKFR
jgi:hypothetical protein